MRAAQGRVYLMKAVPIVLAASILLVPLLVFGQGSDHRKSDPCVGVPDEASAQPLNADPNVTLQSFMPAPRHGMVMIDDPIEEVTQIFGLFDDDDEQIRPRPPIAHAGGIVRLVLQEPSLHHHDALPMIRHTVLQR
jgi:hypothetical protein